MPVDLRKHDPDGPIDIRPGTNKARIIKLLYGDPNLGFTPAEIRAELDLARGSTSPTLSRMLDDGLIGKTSDGLYHGLNHREDLRRFAASIVQLDRMFTNHPEVGIDSEDIAQTGDGARERIPDERLQRTDETSAEPAPKEWVSTDDA